MGEGIVGIRPDCPFIGIYWDIYIYMGYIWDIFIAGIYLGYIG
jgi:hypothetical protein